MVMYKCEKCLPTNVPNEWTVEKKIEIAARIRETNPIFAIKYFRPVGMNFSDAKNIALHITNEKGFCHYCKTQLVEQEGNCPKCKRLNLDW